LSTTEAISNFELAFAGLTRGLRTFLVAFGVAPFVLAADFLVAIYAPLGGVANVFYYSILLRHQQLTYSLICCSLLKYNKGAQEREVDEASHYEAALYVRYHT
jgi:hypothetical protein